MNCGLSLWLLALHISRFLLLCCILEMYFQIIFSLDNSYSYQ